MEIPYVNIERQECYTPERAEAMLADIEAREKYHQEHYGRPVSMVHTRKIVGTCIVVFSFNSINLGEVRYLHHLENKHKDAMHLMTGRTVLPPIDGEESGNLLHGLDLEQ